MRSFVTPIPDKRGQAPKVGLALAIIYTAKIFSLIQPLYQNDSGQAGMTSTQKPEEP